MTEYDYTFFLPLGNLLHMQTDPQSRELLHDEEGGSTLKQQAQCRVDAILSVSPELAESIEILDADGLGIQNFHNCNNLVYNFHEEVNSLLGRKNLSSFR